MAQLGDPTAGTRLVRRCTESIQQENIRLALFTLLAFEIHGHHPPSEILHALLVGQLGLCSGIQSPNLSGQWILLLHLVGALRIRP